MVEDAKYQPTSQLEEKGSHKQPKNDRTRPGSPQLKPEEEQVFQQALRALQESGIGFIVGGAFAKYFYTDMWRYTKDLDVFLKPEALKTVLEVLRAAGFETEITDPRWLAKAFKDDQMVAILFGTGHGLIPVDERLFEGSIPAEVFGVDVRLMSVEELIVLAVFIAARDRFDGGDIVHLIRAKQGNLDWERIVERLGEHRQLLLWQLIFFDYVYPGHTDYLPQDLIERLFAEMRQRWSQPGQGEKTFRGTLLDRYSYTVDVEEWGYANPRQKQPLVNEQGEVL